MWSLAITASMSWVSLAAPTTYEPGLHVAFLNNRFAEVQQTVEQLQDGELGARPALQRLGKTLGESRTLQQRLSSYMAGAKAGEDGTLTLRLIQAQGLFEAYLTAEILAIEGDEDAKTLSDSLESRLSKILPKFSHSE